MPVHMPKTTTTAAGTETTTQTETENAAAIAVVSLEFLGSDYPAETLVRIQQKQQQKQQECVPAFAVPPTAAVAFASASGITTNTTTSTTTGREKKNKADIVFQVTLQVGDVVALYPPQIQEAASESWEPLELELVQFVLELEPNDNGDGNDDKGLLTQTRDPQPLCSVVAAATVSAVAPETRRSRENQDQKRRPGDSVAKAITAVAVTAAAVTLDTDGAHEHTSDERNMNTNTAATKAKASTSALSLYATALQAVEEDGHVPLPVSLLMLASPTPTRAMVADICLGVEAGNAVDGDYRGASEDSTRNRGTREMVHAKAEAPPLVVAAFHETETCIEDSDDSSDDNDRLFSQAEEYHVDAVADDDSDSENHDFVENKTDTVGATTPDHPEEARPESVQQLSLSISIQPLPPLLPSPTHPLPHTVRTVTKEVAAVLPVVEDKREQGDYEGDHDLSENDNRKQDGTCTGGGSELAKVNDMDKPPLTASVVNHNAAETQSRAQPSLSNVNATLPLARPMEQAVTTPRHFGELASANNGFVMQRDDDVVVDVVEPAIASTVTLTTPQSRDLSTSNSVVQGTKQPESAKKFVLYFVQRGVDMERVLLDGDDEIEGLKEHCRQRGASILEAFDKNHPPWPTHLVISKLVKVQSVVDELGFEEEQVLEEFLGERNIVCAKRQWAAEGNQLYRPPFREPTMMEKYLGIWPKKRASPDAKKRSSRSVRRRTEGSAAPATGNASFSNVAWNRQLSEVFHKLSKLHQACPLNESDDWKAYSFNVTSGRLRHLGFEIANEPEVLAQVKRVQGIGPSQMQIIKEFLETGTLERIKQFETDPRRVAMKRFMNIWGVGRIKAFELLAGGYETIEQVRQAVESGKVTLERNQYIGLDCYDDIQERMSRSEVEKIAEIITDTFKTRFPSAEITTMGSYRRGKRTCGDVDVMITHPAFFDVVPPRALGEVIDDLLNQGHISHHLTFISGMNYDNYESLPQEVVSKFIKPKPYGSKGKKDKFSGSSYMGVFHSPVVKGRRRRVDVKFYPYRERIFASLYFTGNGHFNRSMRLWATRKFDYTLNDHGLFKKNTHERVLEATSEKQVFEFLDLVWKEPHERDCFDAVKGKGTGETAAQLEDLSKSDLRRESQEHAWID
jgi:DNA polymerase/3'-5' exonuclease PolX